MRGATLLWERKLGKEVRLAWTRRGEGIGFGSGVGGIMM